MQELKHSRAVVGVLHEMGAELAETVRTKLENELPDMLDCGVLEIRYDLQSKKVCINFKTSEFTAGYGDMRHKEHRVKRIK